VKGAARFVALVGAAALAFFLFRSSPRDVTLVYDLGAGSALSLQVVIRKGDEVVRRATFPSPGAQVRHAVRLTDGVYRVEYRLERPSGVVEGGKDIAVSESGTIVLSVGP